MPAVLSANTDAAASPAADEPAGSANPKSEALIGNVKEFAKLQEGALHALANTNPAALLFDDGLLHLFSCIVLS